MHIYTLFTIHIYTHINVKGKIQRQWKKHHTETRWLTWAEIRFPRMHIGYQQQTGSNVREMGQHFPYEESFCASTLNPLLWKGSPGWSWNWNRNYTSLLIEEHIPEFSMVPSSQTGRAGSCEVFSQQKAKEGKVNTGAWDTPPRKDWLNERELWKLPKLFEIKSCLLLRLGASFQEKHKVLWGKKSSCISSNAGAQARMTWLQSSDFQTMLCLLCKNAWLSYGKKHI